MGSGLYRFSVGIFIIVMFASVVHADSVITGTFPSFNSSNIGVFSLNGNAALSGSRIQLTPALGNRFGSAFWTNKVALQNLSSFSAMFSFNISSPGGGGADGIVFILQNESNAAGTPGGGIGFAGIKNAFGVEIDTWQNAEYGDPNGNHIGVDLSSYNGSDFIGNVSSNVTLANPGGYNDFSDGAIYYVWIDYDGLHNNLTVRVNRNNNTRPANSQLNATINLTASHIPDQVYVGFSAATGGAWEDQSINSLYFSADYLPTGITPNVTNYTSGVFAINMTTASRYLVPDGVSSTSINVTAVDIYGNPFADQTLTFNTTGGTLNISSSITYDNGPVVLNLTSSTTPGNVTVRATAEGGAVYAEIQIAFQNDTVYPVFRNLTDTNGTVEGSGIARFNMTVNATNGTVRINFNGTNYTPTNASGKYLFAINVTNGTYNYTWFAYGSGFMHNFNSTVARTYVVLPFIDTDHDNISDTHDELFGNESDVGGSGVSGLNITIDGNSTYGTYDDVRQIVMQDSESWIVNFTHNFSRSMLNLSKVTLIRDGDSVIVNLSGQLQNNTYRKTIYLPDNGFTALCVKEAEISSISAMSSDCSAGDEVDFTSCIGNATGVTIGNLTCVDNGTVTYVANLTYSALRGTPAPTTTTHHHSGGGGGGGSWVSRSAYCGDKTCGANETCTSCAKDCGACPPPAPVSETAAPAPTATAPVVTGEAIAEQQTDVAPPAVQELPQPVQLADAQSSSCSLIGMDFGSLLGLCWYWWVLLLAIVIAGICLRPKRKHKK